MPDYTLADVVGALEQVHNDNLEIMALLRERNAISQPSLYCPPDKEGYCPGGKPLKRSFYKGQPNPDKLYHELPESQYHIKEFEDGTKRVKNHNVWRSKALTFDQASRMGLIKDDADASGDEDEPQREPTDDEIRRAVAGLVRRLNVPRDVSTAIVGERGAVAFVREHGLTKFADECERAMREAGVTS